MLAGLPLHQPPGRGEREHRAQTSSSTQTGAWSLASSCPRAARSTPAAVSRAARSGLKQQVVEPHARRCAASGCGGSPRRCRPVAVGCSARSASVQPWSSRRRKAARLSRLDQRVVVVGAGRIDVARLGHDVVVAGEHHRRAGRQQVRRVQPQPLVPGELVVELRPRLRVAVRRVERGDEHAADRRLDVAALRVAPGRRAARRGSGPARRRARGSRRRSSSPARARPRRSPPPRSPRAGTAASVAFSSCRQTTSGSAASSQPSRFASRLTTPLMLKVAILSPAQPRPPAQAATRAATVRRWSAGGRSPRRCLARLQVVVAVLEPQDLDPRRQRVARDLLARPERVARALADQRRRRQPLEVRGAQLLRPPRRMERIAEAEEARDRPGRMQLVGHHAGDPPAHRLAADHQPPRRRRAPPPRRGTRASRVSARGGGRRWPLRRAAM